MSTHEGDQNEAAEELIRQMEAILQPGTASALAAETSTVLMTYMNHTQMVCTVFVLVHKLLNEDFEGEFVEEVARRLMFRFWPHPTDFSTDQMMVLRDLKMMHDEPEGEAGNGEGSGGG